jgi:hypothetical protein
MAFQFFVRKRIPAGFSVFAPSKSGLPKSVAVAPTKASMSAFPSRAIPTPIPRANGVKDVGGKSKIDAIVTQNVFDGRGRLHQARSSNDMTAHCACAGAEVVAGGSYCDDPATGLVKRRSPAAHLEDLRRRRPPMEEAASINKGAMLCRRGRRCLLYTPAITDP